MASTNATVNEGEGEELEQRMKAIWDKVKTKVGEENILILDL